MRSIYQFLSIILITGGSQLIAQEKESNDKIIERMGNQISNLRHSLDELGKGIDDILWYQKVGDVAHVDKVTMTGPPLWKEKDTTSQGYGNQVIFTSYVFVPKDIDPNKKYPLIVFPHGGVHSSFGTFYAHIIRELIAQQYIVVAAEYRGSTGYGKRHYENIDYGGREVGDVDASREFMIENYNFVDENRIGIIGWSHGGLITLLNIFEKPNNYKVAYAGVPVSDLVARMGYKTQGYRDLYSADYHIGKTAYEDVAEYKRRSPAYNAHKLKNTPLLIHTNTNDDDVNVLEVEHLISSLKANNKKFEYKIYEEIPGGHIFNRIDTKHAREVRVDIYKYLDKYLDSPRKIRTVKELNKASYKGF
ncbi:alpha/beta hydrolase family protein [Gelidibacter salicanalis]|uniref:S9 family peptidase n=1 Tax=Gelidibacter salicanalis TaxID=291193 RepID=A0A934KP81_9FLAO|nr:prolyl oligopeptidase family serine peptidase [Gelidibacter salicanalis]MBJ7879605.1 S9 family peptidase [Gelidibacter salicanalis]